MGDLVFLYLIGWLPAVCFLGFLMTFLPDDQTKMTFNPHHLVGVYLLFWPIILPVLFICFVVGGFVYCIYSTYKIVSQIINIINKGEKQ